ncbi:FBD-associated F-box protein At4g10400-like [Nymphaea colorata]|nr:FBD-associated F-box protein At4g10400-like [Nymphaea colorata]
MKGTTGYRRINELPDEILLHMLCFLPIKDAVRTSILSKRWMNLWMGIPSLVFDEKDFPLRRRSRLPLDGTDLFTVVDRFMMNHHKFIRSLCLLLTLRKNSERILLSSWIRHAIAVNQVEELSLQISYSDHRNELYELPLHSCDCRSIHHLKLRGSYFCSRLGSEVLLSSLQSLSLFDVHSNVAHFSNMLRASPLLEKLIICGCSAHADYVQISSKSLRTLSVKNFKFAKLEIIAPSLQTFECDCYPEHDEKCCLNVLFGDIHSIRILDACTCICDVLGKQRNGVTEHPIFHELEEIIVRPCSWKLQVEYLLSLLRSSPFLRSLCIEGEFSKNKLVSFTFCIEFVAICQVLKLDLVTELNLAGTDLSCLLYSYNDAPHVYAGHVLPCLRDLDIDCLHGNEWERKFVKHIIEGAPSLQYVRIWIDSEETLTTGLLNDFLYLQQIYPHLNITFLRE